MNKQKLIFLFSVIFFVVLVFYLFRPDYDIKIVNPYPESVFPPDFASPTFEWQSRTGRQEQWEITLKSKNVVIKKVITDKSKWQPDIQEWNAIKKDLTSFTFEIKKSTSWFRKKSLECSFSPDSVNAPILYRQMPIPFVLAEKVLDSMSYKLLHVGSNSKPETVMQGFQVCGNCHSFSADGNTIGLDLDAGRRDKGGYFISELSDTITFSKSNYISWSNLENQKTFGFLSRLSPDGRYVLTTVKDRVISKNFDYIPEHIAFSQLFFPVNGHLAIYDRKTQTLKELKGANSADFVQTNGVWSPDGKTIYFARSKAFNEGNYGINIIDDQLIEDFVSRKRGFKYDIFSIPFNDGEGGEAVPVKGASMNGKSNFFPIITPDGKWIIFCQAENFMLLQPDSKLFIVSVEGGEAKKMECNLPLMNSWHSISPNGRWLVFASKGMSIYTDMFLTHIDENGKASVPVLIDKARDFRKVINYPEFLNKDSGFSFQMDYKYVELVHIQTAIENSNIREADSLYTEYMKQGHFFFEEDYSQLNMLKKEIEKMKKKSSAL